eukprot:2582840-Amphidinium_carterae.2
MGHCINRQDFGGLVAGQYSYHVKHITIMVFHNWSTSDMLKQHTQWLQSALECRIANPSITRRFHPISKSQLLTTQSMDKSGMTCCSKLKNYVIQQAQEYQGQQHLGFAYKGIVFTVTAKFIM